ncbi:MAG: hypothetical protein A2Z35_03930 [Actinobacteria bacterium RBG_19FT_COMBO_36_27]|nr:MAG: hypothetical protein A2Z35_03930 [Actinobacteria bacterium RBG_19FT_COMBO_36_27]
MKKRMQITISEEVKKQMDNAKEFYGGYSGIIEKAVVEFFSRPVEPYDDDIKDIEEAKKTNEWIDLAVLKSKIQQR